MARVGAQVDAGSIQLNEGKPRLHRRPPEDAWRRPPRRSEARPLPCRPSMRIEPAPASGSRAPKQKATTAVPACSFSSSSTAASAREPESARLASAADHIGAGHAARPSSAITTRISRRPPSSRLGAERGDPLPDELAPDRRDIVRRRASFAHCAAQCASRNPRRESRSISAVSSLGSPVASMRDYA